MLHSRTDHRTTTNITSVPHTANVRAHRRRRRLRADWEWPWPCWRPASSCAGTREWPAAAHWNLGGTSTPHSHPRGRLCDDETASEAATLHRREIDVQAIDQQSSYDVIVPYLSNQNQHDLKSLMSDCINVTYKLATYAVDRFKCATVYFQAYDLWIF